MGYSSARAFIDAWPPDAVISTYPVAGGVVSDIKDSGARVRPTYVITDFGVHRQWLHPATDLFFVACREVGEDIVARACRGSASWSRRIPIHERFSEQLDRPSAARSSGWPTGSP